MKRQNYTGSITVFSALSLMLVAQLLFALLESARNIEFYKVLQMNTDAVLESVFAGYSSPLWENYRLLGVSAQDQEGDFSLNNREAEMRNLSKANLASRKTQSLFGGNSLLTADMTDVEFQSYLLMTDEQGKVFQAAVASYMKQNFIYEAAQSVYSTYESTKDIQDAYGDGEASISGALDALENIEASESGAATKNYSRKGDSRQAAIKGTSAESQEKSEDNVLTTVSESQKTGILELVLPENAKLSGATLNLENAVSHRRLEKGKNGGMESGDWYDQVLFNQYLVHYLTDYTDGVDDRGLNYELEYLIGGKSEDAANLKIAVTEILAMREAENLASLAASSVRQAEALALATVLAGATANPLVIEAVKYGIMAAWAYAESVLDLRTLLQGGKVALLKSDADWTSDLDAIPGLLSGWSQAKTSSVGMSYQDYLGLLLFFHGEGTLSMRAMDVQEAAVRKAEGYENFRMDCLICEAKVCGTYTYVPVFSGFVTLTDKGEDRFCIQATSDYSYFHSQSE